MKIKAAIWQAYSEGHDTPSYFLTGTDMSDEAGWFKVKEVEIEFEPLAFPRELMVAQLKAKARRMQAVFEAAHGEVLDQINRLLAIENSK